MEFVKSEHQDAFRNQFFINMSLDKDFTAKLVDRDDFRTVEQSVPG